MFGWQGDFVHSLEPLWLKSLPQDNSPEAKAEFLNAVAALIQSGAASYYSGESWDRFGPPMVVLPLFITFSSGKWRLILDARYVNLAECAGFFVMPSVEELISMFRNPRDNIWLAKADLKNGWYHVPLGDKLKPFLCFQFGGAIYHFNVLPFGLSSAPRALNELTKWVSTYCRRDPSPAGIFYVDDWLFPWSTIKCVAQANWDDVRGNLGFLGFIFGLEKITLVVDKSMDFLGMFLDLVKNEIRVGAKRLAKIRVALAEVKAKPTATSLARLVGLFSSSRLVIPEVKLLLTDFYPMLGSALVTGEWLRPLHNKLDLQRVEYVILHWDWLNSRPLFGLQIFCVYRLPLQPVGLRL